MATIKSIEQKAKAYDEAIKYAQYLMNERCKEGTDGSFHRADLDKMFPELQESEDERIRKAIINLVETEFGDRFPFDGFTREQMLDWLEKQCEQKSYASETMNEKGDFDSGFTRMMEKEQKPADKVEQKGMNIVEEDMTPFQKKVFCIIDTTIEEEQGLKQVCDELLRLAHDEIMQKPAWSEEDEKMLVGCVQAMCTPDAYSLNDRINFEYWLKSLKDRILPTDSFFEWFKKGEQSVIENYGKYGLCKPTEWSEDVEGAISLLKDIAEEQDKDYCPYNANDLRKAAQYLETCRPQSHWKPSDEQMRVLNLAIRCGINRGTIEETTLVSLFNDLKKLKS